ncbi:PAS domain-containing protein [Haladaptatus salinisoli]|uniref:PAS domain-containing protein n=1 Tax=Haladaptatus salinisoli TaxID=2884876 RepID=UPI001D0A4732|nr:PAS domain-containing protein [Haladaptatus salinisoli]
MASDRVTDSETFTALGNVGADHEPVTADEIADALGCTRRAAYKKLEELHDRGAIHTKKVCARVRVWWRPADSSTGRSAQKYRTLFESINEGFCIIEMSFDEGDPVDYRFLETNPAFEEHTGFTDAEGEWMRDLEPDHEQYWFDRYGDVALTGEPETFEAKAEALDRWYNVYAFPFGGHESQQVAVLFDDITERKQAEEARQKSKERFRALITASSDVVYRMSPDWSEMHELEGKEFLADTAEPTSNWLDKYIHPDEQPRVLEAIDEAIRTKSLFELEHRVEQEDGSAGWTFSRAIPMLDEDGEIEEWIGMASDITERKQHERALEESERRYRTLAEHFPNGAVGVYDHDLRYTLTQGATLGDTLPGRDQLEGRTMPEVFPSNTVDDLEPLFRAAVEDGETDSTTTEFGGRTWRVWATPLRDADGDIFAGLSFAQDITERVEREQRLEKTVEKLEQSNDRLESFASTLAHELRNPVMIGQMYCNELPEADSEAVGYVAEAFDRIEEMIDVILAVTRGHEAVGERVPVDLTDVARRAWDDVDAPDATVDGSIDRTVHADETYVEHLFRNLFDNAVEHGRPDVTITVGDLPTGFFVADDGPGIPVADRDDVFKLGFTTTVERGGTGIGLAFVKRLADVYEWDCRVTESESDGARFEFTNVDRGSSQR